MDMVINSLLLFNPLPGNAGWVFSQVLSFIGVILICRIGYYVWTRQVSRYRTLIAGGALLVLLSSLSSVVFSYMLLAIWSFEDEKMIVILQVNSFVSSAAHLLFFWGIFQFFTKEWRRENDQPDLIDNLIE